VAITGASAGIGRATAVRLAREGAALVICARRPEPLESAADEIRRAGGDVLPITADVTSEPDMNLLVARAVERFGRLDVMMCNAGFGIYGAIDQIEPARMRQLLDVNYMGTYLAARAALPLFRQQRSGHLIVVSSIVGRRGIPFMGAYAVRVQSLATVEAVLKEGHLPMRRLGAALIVPFPAELGVGAWLFVENAGDLPWRS